MDWMRRGKWGVEAILDGNVDKALIWGVNIDDDYHEAKSKGDDPHDGLG